MKKFVGLIFLVLILGCTSRDSSSRRRHVDPDEVKRLRYYHSVGKTMNQGSRREKHRAVMDMMGKMQSGQIPKDAAQDFKRLNEKYSR